jgi:hypothetical protein
MGLKEPFMTKDNFGGAAASLSLEAKTGESLLVKGLRFGALHSGGFAECLIDRLSVGFWYIGDINANHLEQCSVTSLRLSVFQSLIDRGVFKGYPIAEGDMTPDMPNGSATKEYLFLNYGTNAAEIAIDGIGPLDKTRNPSEYPAFPFGDIVPARTEIEILGVLLMTWKDAVGNLNPNYAYLKLLKERKVLFDEDRNGLYVREGMGRLTWGPCRQTNVDLELFPEPLLFGPGEELLVQMSAGDTAIAIDDIMLATIQRVRKLD